jgi:superfamily II DNA helicase RecQ
VEELRAIYRELARQIPHGKATYVNLDELERLASAALNKRFDATTVRVAVSLLERVGLIVRHFDAPRTVMLTVTPEGWMSGDERLTSLLQVSRLPQGKQARLDVGATAEELSLAPDTLEQLLLEWQEKGWLRYRSERRDPVIERLVPPQDVAGAINKMLREQDNAQQHQIEQMIDYASRDRCRHKMLAAHLGEKIDDCRTSCDHCAPPSNRPAAQTKQARALPDNPGQVILECLLSFPFNVGKPSLVKALSGSAASNVSADRVRHFGALEGASPSSIEHAIDELVEAGYLNFYETEEGYKLVQPTDKAEDGIPTGTVSVNPKRQPKALKPDESAGRDRQPAVTRASAFGRIAPEPEEERQATPEEADLFERLRAWRRVTANRLNLPPYVIFHDRTLWAIARAHPHSEEEFLAIKGIGPGNLERYGSDLFELMAESEE